ncbi:ubiquitin carboxyl-terminal hydrolase 34-like, partial [Protopterus annectens]|uniref:ubiquitin carboxyl-terminal hydrolase 34-like n=1 Tax=Protopterus annectens TaxID=7888 RepID=UPI001CFA75EB
CKLLLDILIYLCFLDDEGATPVKRRRVSSDEEHTVDSCNSDLKTEPREALTPSSTSDNETRDSSIIDPGTEQDPPSPENVSVRDYKMETSSTFSEDVKLSTNPQHTEELLEGEGKLEECRELKEPHVTKHLNTTDDNSDFLSTSISTVLSDLAELRNCESQEPSSQDPETSLSVSCAHSRGLFSHTQQDLLDTLCRTIQSAINIATRISAQGNRAVS